MKEGWGGAVVVMPPPPPRPRPSHRLRPSSPQHRRSPPPSAAVCHPPPPPTAVHHPPAVVASPYRHNAGCRPPRWQIRPPLAVACVGRCPSVAIRGHRGRDERHRIGLPPRAIHPPQPLSSSSTLHPLPPTSSAVPPLFTTARRPLCSTHGAPSAQPTGAAAITAHRAATFHLFVYHKLAPGGR